MFKVDGREFYIPTPGIDDVQMLDDIAKLTRVEQAQAMRDVLAAKSRPVRLTLWERFVGRDPVAVAIDQLGLTQTSELFKAWITSLRAVSLGESSGSAD